MHLSMCVCVCINRGDKRFFLLNERNEKKKNFHSGILLFFSLLNLLRRNVEYTKKTSLVFSFFFFFSFVSTIFEFIIHLNITSRFRRHCFFFFRRNIMNEHIYVYVINNNERFKWTTTTIVPFG